MSETGEYVGKPDVFSEWVNIDAATRAKFPTLTPKTVFFMGLFTEECLAKLAKVGLKNVRAMEPTIYSLVGLYPEFPTFSGQPGHDAAAIQNAKDAVKPEVDSEFARRYRGKTQEQVLQNAKQKWTVEMNMLEQACAEWVFPELQRNGPLRTALKLRRDFPQGPSPEQFMILQEEIKQSGIAIEILDHRNGIRSRNNHAAFAYRPEDNTWILQLDMEARDNINEYVHELAAIGIFKQLHDRNQTTAYKWGDKLLRAMGAKQHNRPVLKFLYQEKPRLRGLALYIFDYFPEDLVRLDR